MNIAFSRTLTALLTGAKTVTRRDWKESHAAKFHAGQICDAWSHSPRTPHARRLACIQLTTDPYRERIVNMPRIDLQLEGGMWQDITEFVTDVGHNLTAADDVTVVRFGVLGYYVNPIQRVWLINADGGIDALEDYYRAFPDFVTQARVLAGPALRAVGVRPDIVRGHRHPEIAAHGAIARKLSITPDVAGTLRILDRLDQLEAFTYDGTLYPVQRLRSKTT